MLPHQTQAGCSGIQHLGKDIHCAPPSAASWLRLHVFFTELWRSSQAGFARVTATYGILAGVSTIAMLTRLRFRQNRTRNCVAQLVLC